MPSRNLFGGRIWERKHWHFELEGPGQKLRIRRKQFYLRNGMKETGVKVCLFQIPMELLTDGQDMVFEEYHEFYEQTIGPVFARKVERL